MGIAVAAGNSSTEIDIARIQADSFNAPRDVHKPTFRRSNRRQRFHLTGACDMNFRFSPLAMGASFVVTVLLTSSVSWAHFYELGPAKDEWGLKYEGEVTAAGDKLNVSFTLADQGRLKPIYSVSLVAFSDLRKDGGRTYLVNSTFDLKPTRDGKLTGQLQIDKRFADRIMVRILTLTFDGKPQTAGARYYQIPLKHLMKKTPAPASFQTPAAIASPPAPTATK